MRSGASEKRSQRDRRRVNTWRACGEMFVVSVRRPVTLTLLVNEIAPALPQFRTLDARLGASVSQFEHAHPRPSPVASRPQSIVTRRSQ